MKKRNAFTIIELLIVVIIIGVLATIAVPQFTKAVEKTKIAKAKTIDGLVYKAAMIYRQDVDGGNGDFQLSGKEFNISVADGIIELGLNTTNWKDHQNDFSYSVTATATNSFEVTGYRQSGPYGQTGKVCTVTMDQDQKITVGQNCPK